MKKRILGILSAVMVLAIIIIPVSGVAGAQSDTTDEVTSEVRPALAIRCPTVVMVGQPVTIQVVDRNTGRPVPRAGVWAVHVDGNTTVDAASVLSAQCGYFIDWTDANGEVEHSFRMPGQYVLAAVKDSYLPVFTQLTAKSHKTLAIKAPDKARVGSLVTIGVYDSNSSRPVAKAAVWAVRIDNTITPTTTTTIAPTETVPINEVITEINDAEAYVDLARERGYLIGYTDENGIVEHRFGAAGTYILVAIKEGYAPGIKRIQIVELQVQAQKTLSSTNGNVTVKPIRAQVSKVNSVQASNGIQ